MPKAIAETIIYSSDKYKRRILFHQACNGSHHHYAFIKCKLE